MIINSEFKDSKTPTSRRMIKKRKKIKKAEEEKKEKNKL
jgi:hypothetical protein